MNQRSVSFRVTGKPKGQPRVKAFRRGERAGVFTPNSADDWRSAVGHAWQAQERPHVPPKASVALFLTFTFQRPKAHVTTKGRLSKQATGSHVTKPDASNLAKLVEDVLTDLQAWKDDSQVATLVVVKQYAEIGQDWHGLECRYTWWEEEQKQ